MASKLYRCARSLSGSIIVHQVSMSCAGSLGHLFINRDVREHDLARITHLLHTEMPCQESGELASRCLLNMRGDLSATRQKDGVFSSFVKENGAGNAPTPSRLDTTMP